MTGRLVAAQGCSDMGCPGRPVMLKKHFCSRARLPRTLVFSFLGWGRGAESSGSNSPSQPGILIPGQALEQECRDSMSLLLDVVSPQQRKHFRRDIMLYYFIFILVRPDAVSPTKHMSPLFRAAGTHTSLLRGYKYLPRSARQTWAAALFACRVCYRLAPNVT